MQNLESLKNSQDIQADTYDREQGLRHGRIVGEVLRHASSAAIELDHFRNESAGCKVAKVAIRGAYDLYFDEYEEFDPAEIAASLKNKSLYRTEHARFIASAKFGVKISDIESQEVIAEGILQAANLKAGTVNVATDDDACLVVTYGQELPVPDELEHQNFFGFELTVDFEITSVPLRSEWLLR